MASLSDREFARRAFFSLRENGAWVSPSPGGERAVVASASPMVPGSTLSNNRTIAKSVAALHCADYRDTQTAASPTRIQPRAAPTTWCSETAFLEPLPTRGVPAPALIETTFSTDLNILKIHEAICAKFASMFSEAPEQIARAHRLFAEAAESGSGLTLVERQAMHEKAREMECEARRVESRETWREYCALAKPHLEAYAPVASDEARGAVIIGAAEGDQDARSAAAAATRVSAILDYLTVAKRYITIYAHQVIDDVAVCPACGALAADPSSGDEHATAVCECGRVAPSITRSASYKDSARIDIGSRCAYDNLANFEKRIDAYEGRQKKKPPAHIYEQLEAHFAANPLPCGKTPADIRAMPLDASGKKPGTSIAALISALQTINNSEYYRDVELIAHKLWGWALPDITSNGLRAQLIADYRATQRVYNEIKKQRNSSLNVNIRLFYHLRARGYPCLLSDFKTILQRDSLEYHKSTLRVMSEKCGLPIVKLE